MQNDKSVTKDEFEKFISEYPNALRKHTVAFYDPPLVTWNDFSLGEYPEKSVVAYAKLNEDGALYDFYIRERT